MRQIHTVAIKEALKRIILEASYNIGSDVEDAIKSARDNEPMPSSKNVLDQILENYEIARTDNIAICQDTGMCVVFLDVGQDVHIEGDDISKAINDAVASAYKDGCLRKSVVADPLYDRVNTRDNTPAIIYTSIVPGDKIDISITLKGFGSENMSAIRMLTPAAGESGVIDFVTQTVINAGPNPCPPVIVGVGIGGTMDMAAVIAKRMTMRPINERNSNPSYARLEEIILERINRSGVGPSGIGGRTTALSVNIGAYPTHIAGMPVAVNVCCHAARHAHITL